MGQPPVGARVYSLQKLRCNLCGVVFTAEPPAESCGEKYDATVGSMIALLKYGTGVPFHRNEILQENLGVPLPASTQWDIVAAQAERAESVFEELLRQAVRVPHDDRAARGPCGRGPGELAAVELSRNAGDDEPWASVE